ALLPLGGAKGTCLGLLVEVLSGVITGAGVSHGVGSMFTDFTRSGDSGHFLLALDISRWMPMEAYIERLEALLAIIEGSGAGVRVPGAVRWQKYDDSIANGISLDPKLRAELEKLARPHAIASPWEMVMSGAEAAG